MDDIEEGKEGVDFDAEVEELEEDEVANADGKARRELGEAPPPLTEKQLRHTPVTGQDEKRLFKELVGKAKYKLVTTRDNKFWAVNWNMLAGDWNKEVAKQLRIGGGGGASSS